MKRLAAELVDGLSSMGNLAGAATVAVQYLADVDNGVSLLAQAREWREALRTAYRYVPAKHSCMMEALRAADRYDFCHTLLLVLLLCTQRAHFRTTFSMRLVGYCCICIQRAADCSGFLQNPET